MRWDEYYIVKGETLIMVRRILRLLKEDVTNDKPITKQEMLDRLDQTIRHIPLDPPRAF